MNDLTFASLPYDFMYITKLRRQYERHMFKDKLHGDDEEYVLPSNEHSCITTNDHSMCVVKRGGQLAYTDYGQLWPRFLVEVLAQVVFISYKSLIDSSLTCLFQVP